MVDRGRGRRAGRGRDGRGFDEEHRGGAEGEGVEVGEDGGGAAEGDQGEVVAVLVRSGDGLHEGLDSVALVELEGAVLGSLVVEISDEQGVGVNADQELDGGGIEVSLGDDVQRKAEVNVGDVQDVPLLGVQLGQIEHALQHRNRRLPDGRLFKRSGSCLVLVEELVDCSRGASCLMPASTLYHDLR